MTGGASRTVDIEVNLWPGDCWEKVDLEDLQSALAPIGSTNGSRTNELRGMGLQVTLAFVAGAVAGGFFNALGADVYGKIKAKIKSILARPTQRHPEWKQDDCHDSLATRLVDRDLGIDLYIRGCFLDEQELAEFLRVVPDAYFAVIEAVTNGRSPCIKGKFHVVHATWFGSPGPEPEWDISVIVRESADPEDDPCLLGLNAFVRSGGLTPAAWPYLQWLDSATAHKHRERARASRWCSVRRRSTKLGHSRARNPG